LNAIVLMGRVELGRHCARTCIVTAHAV